ncbi:hypothetical protein CYY_009964 [Polysphondylium violaceum]|uniref:Vesicle tethering protein Uso1/P115-like head domain-containing protein n=1 Tax=Polysphondylium violaceum TaxID=133409 RepID=A0A8J4PJM5_9MYCE|nr:hypothetical protein CYY_009964 [Polysphondylium violaceum]
MSWFGGWNSVKQQLGAVAPGSLSGSSSLMNDAVVGLLDKIQNATDQDYESKRDAIHQLTSINKSLNQLVGSRMSVLTKALEQHKKDIEIIREIVQILTLIMTTSPKDDNIIEIHNTELFITDKNNFKILCDLLSINDYYVRYYIISFIFILIKNRFEAVQDAILGCPMAMPNIMSLLQDNRDVIRNETILVILELTKSNQEIQKIVAFESAFETLLNIIKKEGSSEGGIIVNDCILVLINLLKGNVLNQNFFRETGCIQTLLPLLQVQNTDMWILSDNKFTIIMSTLDLILTLVERNNLSTPTNQHIIVQCGIMNLIIRLGLGKMSSQVIRSKSLFVLGEIIYQNPENISEFASVTIKSEVTKESKTALLRLTTVMLYSKDLQEKLSAFHVFKSYLFNNEEAQMALASTIMFDNNSDNNNSSNNSNTSTNNNSNNNIEFENLSIGQHLYKILFSWETPTTKPFDISSFWFSSLVLLYMIKDSTHTKDQLLNMPLEIPKSTSGGDSPSPIPTLFIKLMTCLLNTSKKQDIDPMIKIGLLKLLAVWLDKSPKSIKLFFQHSNYLSFIIETILQPLASGGSSNLLSHTQGLASLIFGICVFYMDDETAESNRSNLTSIINHRIGLNTFKEKLDLVRKSDSFLSAEQDEENNQNQNQNQNQNNDLLLYDFDFTLFFKETFDKIRNIGTTVNKSRPGVRKVNDKVDKVIVDNNSSASSTSLSPPNSTTSPQVSSPSLPRNNSTNNNNELELSQLKSTNNNLSNELIQLKLQIDQQQKQIIQQQQQLVDQSLNQNQNQNQNQNNETNELLQLIQEKEKEVNMLNEAQYRLEDLVVEKDDQIEQLKNQIEFLKNQNQNQNQNNNNNNESVDLFELLRLRQENQEQVNRMALYENEIKQLNQKYSKLSLENNTLTHQLEETKKSIGSPNSSTIRNDSNLKLLKVEGELKEMKSKYEALVKEQDDLLTWSTKLEVENQNLKNRNK